MIQVYDGDGVQPVKRWVIRRRSRGTDDYGVFLNEDNETWTGARCRAHPFEHHLAEKTRRALSRRSRRWEYSLMESP